MEFRIFCSQHDAMASDARAILAHVGRLAAGEIPDGHDPLPQLRLSLSRRVAQHCSAEIDRLNTHLDSYPRLKVERADLVRRYHDELLAWRGALMQCNANWPARQVIQSPAAFLDVFRPLTQALLIRIQWEEQQFYPKVMGRTIARRL